MTLATGILVGMMVAWFSAPPEATQIATLLFLVTLGVTLGSLWHTELRGRPAGPNFMYAQVLFDAAVVTTIIYITSSGAEMSFAPLYILVITEGALLLPLPGGVLIGALSSILYLAGFVWGRPEDLPLNTVGLQIALFAVVALITGWAGDRVQRTWLAAGKVQSELVRLRRDTEDILTNISTGVLTVVDGGRLGYLNTAGEGFLNLSLDQWHGAPILDVAEAVAPGLAQALRRSIDGLGPVTRKTTAVKRPTGDLVLGISTTVLESREGEGPSVTAIFQDITDLERIQELNRRNERLEAVAELSASLAHEIKNPLSTIGLNAQLLGEGINDAELPDEDRGQLLRRLDALSREAERLRAILTDFLQFAGRVRLDAQPHDLVAIVDDLRDFFHPQCDQHRIVLRTNLPQTPVPVQADEGLLKQALLNLMINATQAMNTTPGSRATHDQRGELILQLESDDDEARIHAIDTGPGIGADKLERSFMPYVSDKTGGTDLGLSTARRIIEEHGGSIVAHSEPGRGSDFVIHLPKKAS